MWNRKTEDPVSLSALTSLRTVIQRLKPDTLFSPLGCYDQYLLTEWILEHMAAERNGNGYIMATKGRAKLVLY